MKLLSLLNIGLCAVLATTQVFAAGKSFEAKEATRVRENARGISDALKVTGVDAKGIISLGEAAIKKGDNDLAKIIEDVATGLKKSESQANLKNEKFKSTLTDLATKANAISGKAADINNRVADQTLLPDGQSLINAMEGSMGVLRDIVSTKNLESVDMVKAQSVLEKLATISENDVVSGNSAKVKEIETALGVDLETFIKNCRK